MDNNTLGQLDNFFDKMLLIKGTVSQKEENSYGHFEKCCTKMSSFESRISTPDTNGCKLRDVSGIRSTPEQFLEKSHIADDQVYF